MKAEDGHGSALLAAGPSNAERLLFPPAPHGHRCTNGLQGFQGHEKPVLQDFHQENNRSNRKGH